MTLSAWLTAALLADPRLPELGIFWAGLSKVVFLVFQHLLVFLHSGYLIYLPIYYSKKIQHSLKAAYGPFYALWISA